MLHVLRLSGFRSIVVALPLFFFDSPPLCIYSLHLCGKPILKHCAPFLLSVQRYRLYYIYIPWNRLELNRIDMDGGGPSSRLMLPTWASLVSTTAISVATILGTGILALPVTLHKAGLSPFLVTFTATFFAQIGAVYCMVELLQRAYALGPKLRSTEEYTAISSASSASSSPQRDNNNINNNINNGHVSDDEDPMSPSSSMDALTVRPAPSLHTISKLFLSNRVLQLFFEGFVLLHFVSIMVSYALAAPQVLGQLIPSYGRLGVYNSTAAFVTIATCGILLVSKLLYSLLTVATFIKGILLTFLIGLTLLIGMKSDLAPSSEWGLAAVESFLIGSLALSGVVNLMPVTFEAALKSCGPRRPPAVSEDFVVQYRRATILGVFLCYLLNIGWCIGVLFIVPQNTLMIANGKGENSTYPLIQILKRHNTNTSMAYLINLFTAISVTVSFFVVGIGMKHTLDDQLKQTLSRRSSTLKRSILSTLYYATFFGGIGLIALNNPHAFVRLLAGVTSFCLNIEAGVFIVYMLVQSRRPIWNETLLETSLSKSTVAVLVVAVGGYFCSAVFIDLALYIL